MPELFSHILAPIDGSDASLRAESAAIELAARPGRALTFAYAFDGAPLTLGSSRALLDALDAEAQSLLDEAVARAHKAGVSAAGRVVSGEPAAAITGLASELGASVILIGTHGRRGLPRAIVGSTTEGVLRGSSIPVLTLNPDARLEPEAQHPFRTALVAVDDSGPALGAIRTAIALAQTDRVRLQFCRVVDTVQLIDRAAVYGYDPTPILEEMRGEALPVLEQAAAAASAAKVACETLLLEGRPIGLLLERAANVDLVVVGSHGRRGLQRLFLGSVAEELVRAAPVPVLVVRGEAGEVAAPSAGASSENVPVGLLGESV